MRELRARTRARAFSFVNVAPFESGCVKLHAFFLRKTMTGACLEKCVPDLVTTEAETAASTPFLELLFSVLL